MTKKKIHTGLLVAGLLLAGLVDALSRSPWAHGVFGVWIIGVLTQWRHIAGEIDEVVGETQTEAEREEARSVRTDENPTPPERPKAA